MMRMPSFRVLVFGGRDFTNVEEIYDVLDRVHARRSITTLIHGGAAGVDTLGGRWGADRGVLVVVYPANWKRYGLAAGPIRNEQMLREGLPDAAIAFPGGRDTANMAGLLRAQGVPVWEPIGAEVQ